MSSRNRYLAAVLSSAILVGAPLPAQSQKPVKPAASATVTATAPAPKPDFSREAFVIEELKTRYRFEKDGTGSRTNTSRIKVQSEAALAQLGQLAFGYNAANENFKIGYVRVRKADGSVITAPESSVQDMTSSVAREAPIYTDTREKHITVPSLRPGETLEYEITNEIHTPLAVGQFWMDHTFASTVIVLDETLEVDVPRDRVLKLKTKDGFEPKVSEVNGRKVYRWEHSNLSRPDDDDKDKDKKKKDKRRTKPVDAADVQMTTFASWNEMGTWYSGLEKERRNVTPALKAKAEELTKNKTSENERVEAIYDYVAKNIRYVSLSFGVGRYQPHAAADVFNNGYGDCKDKHTLLATLLQAIGLRADTVLIHSTRKLDAEVPSPAQFDHVITRVQGKDAPIWLDTTSEVAPYRVLMLQLRKKNALVVEANGDASVVQTPADLPFRAEEFSTIDGKITDLGKLEAHVKHVSRGDSELMARMTLRRVSQAHWKRIVDFLAAMEVGQGDVTDFKISDPASTREPLVIEYWVSVPNFVEWTRKSSRMRMPLPVMNIGEAPDEDDTEPYRLGAPGVMNMKSSIAVPERFKMRLPLAIELKRDFAEYKSVYKLDGAMLHLERQLTVKQFELPTERFAEYGSFRRVVTTDTNQEIGVEQSEVSAASAGDVQPDDLADAAYAALREGNYKLSAELFERVVTLEPKHKTAWNNLGRAYLNQGMFQRAIEALKKQIEISPYDEWAYNNLGLAYMRSQNHAEAEKAFRKQIEINPLDSYAHANLGELFATQKQWEAAMPELQAAAQITPDNPALMLRVGEAYLNTNQADKAIEMFDRALEKSPNPMIWNNVAYFLADKNVYLDRAKKYAESAVNTVSSALRSMPDEQLTKAGPALTSSLASYWDTLGWVYFRMGELDKAERLTMSAWQQAQHGEVADHLGQIYEKRSDKERAKQFYAMALASPQPEKSARVRLATLLGGDSKVDALVNSYRERLSKERSVIVANAVGKTGSAEFNVTLGPDGKVLSIKSDASSYKDNGEAAKIKDSAQNIVDAHAAKLREAKFAVSFPEDATRIVRKLILTCADAKQCMAVLAPADEFAFANVQAVTVNGDGSLTEVQ